MPQFLSSINQKRGHMAIKQLQSQSPLPEYGSKRTHRSYLLLPASSGNICPQVSKIKQSVTICQETAKSTSVLLLLLGLWFKPLLSCATGNCSLKSFSGYTDPLLTFKFKMSSKALKHPLGPYVGSVPLCRGCHINMSCSHFSSLPAKTLKDQNKEIRKPESAFVVTIWPGCCSRTNEQLPLPITNAVFRRQKYTHNYTSLTRD